MNTQHGRSVHNASEFYDDIRRDTHSNARLNRDSTYLKQQKTKIFWRFQIMKELEKYIIDEKTGLKYELVGDCYYPCL